MALVSVLLIAILLGAIDLARVYQFDTALQEAAREGARHAAWFDGSTNPYLDATDIGSAIGASLQGAGLLGAGQTLSTSASCPASAPTPATVTACYAVSNPPTGVACVAPDGGYDVEVAVKMLFSLLVQSTASGSPGQFVITADSHMRVQGC